MMNEESRQKAIDILTTYCTNTKGFINHRFNDEKLWNKRGLSNERNLIYSLTSFLPENTTLNIRAWHIHNNVPNVPICPNCNENTVNWQTSKSAYSACCSSKCQSNYNIDKRKATCLEKYGVDNPSKTPEVIDKIKSTMLEKYGVDNYSKTNAFRDFIANWWDELADNEVAEIQSKRAETCREKYGADSPLESEMIKEKIMKTMIERHGVSTPLKNPEFVNKAKETMIERYGKSSFQRRHIPQENIDKYTNKEWLEEELKTKSVPQVASEMGITESNLFLYVRKFELTSDKISSFHREIMSVLDSMDIAYEINYRAFLDNKKEIDIYIPAHKLAIECDGVYFHSEIAGRKDKNYHLDKTIKMEDQGFRLLHIFDSEWNDDRIRPIIISKLQHMCGKTETTVYGRKCHIKEIDKETERNFIDENHIQGFTGSSICYGLYYNECLVAVMSFGKPRYNKNYQWELMRFCVKKHYNVIGAFSKMFKHFVNDKSPESIISYCDRRYSDGGVYSVNDMNLVHSSSPSYYYHRDGRILHNRTKFQKHKLSEILENFNPEFTEWENMQAHGFDRVWDCGNHVYEWRC